MRDREQIEAEQQELATRYQQLQQEIQRVQTRIVENRGIPAVSGRAGGGGRRA